MEPSPIGRGQGEGLDWCSYRSPIASVNLGKNVKKAECERAIRALCGKWKKERGGQVDIDGHPSFSEFYSWVQSNYSIYLDFRCDLGVYEQVELWFDQEFKQMWRR
jgi:hypothetical protein